MSTTYVRILTVVALLVVAGASLASVTRNDPFPFVIDANPIIGPGGAGAWDAGGVFGPRVWSTRHGARMLYVGMRHTQPFDNVLALGVATEAPGGAFAKSDRNPVLTADALAPGATGIEMVALIAAGDDAVTFVATLVDAQRKAVGFYRVTMTVDGWRVTASTRLGSAPARAGDWNSAFYLPGAFDPVSGLVIGEGVGAGRPWALGAQALDDDALVWVDDPSTRTPYATSDPILEPTRGGWDRQGMFNPSVFKTGTAGLLLYSGAPGHTGSDEAAHTIGYAVRRDGYWMKPAGDARLIAPEPGAIVEHPMMLAGVDGSVRLFVSRRPASTGLTAIHVATGSLPDDEGLTADHAAYADTRPRWLPDDSRVVFQSDRTGNFDLYSIRPDGTDLHRITRGRGDEVQPAVSPDGRWLAYAANVDRSVYTGRSRYQIHVARVDGAGAARRITSDGSDFFPVWSPDGTQIAFMSDRTGRAEIYVAAVDGSNVRALTVGRPGGPRGNPTWSPDGSAVAFDTAIGGKSEIVSLSLRDGSWTVVTVGLAGDHWYPAWSPDGQEIAFGTFLGSGPTMTHRLSVLRLSDRVVRHLTPPTPPGTARFDYHQAWAHDGRRLVHASNRCGEWRLHVITASGVAPRSQEADSQQRRGVPDCPPSIPVGRLISSTIAT